MGGPSAAWRRDDGRRVEFGRVGGDSAREVGLGYLEGFPERWLELSAATPANAAIQTPAHLGAATHLQNRTGAAAR